jgi:L-fuconolactonase
MPDFPIVDTHVHLVNRDRINYSGLDESLPELVRPFDLSTFHEHSKFIELEAYLFMEVACDATDRMAEVVWVTELAAQDTRLQGIVAAAAIEKGDAVTAELEAYKQNPLVKGIRRLIQSESIEFCLQPSFLDGLRCLPRFDFSFDICISHQQLANVVSIVKQCPEVRFILDHIGKPDIKNQELEPWKSEFKALSELPNVCCKVSGMTTEADHANWTRDDLRPYFDHVIESFGFDRLLFGGDWFVSTLAVEYPEWVATVDWALSGCSEAQLGKLYRDNAREFYKL